MYTSFLLGKGEIFPAIKSSITFVDHTFMHCIFMCPLLVSLDSGKCLFAFLTVSRGHVQFPALIAATRVAFGEYPAAACK
jgi:hypothetical protein